MLEDLRFALRQLHRSPGFAAAVVVTLALAIGANTAVFSLLDGFLLRRLPYPQPDRLPAPVAPKEDKNETPPLARGGAGCAGSDSGGRGPGLRVDRRRKSAGQRGRRRSGALCAQRERIRAL